MDRLQCALSRLPFLDSLAIQLVVELLEESGAGLIGAGEAMMEVDQGVVLLHVLVQSEEDVPAEEEPAQTGGVAGGGGGDRERERESREEVIVIKLSLKMLVDIKKSLTYGFLLGLMSGVSEYSSTGLQIINFTFLYSFVLTVGVCRYFRIIFVKAIFRTLQK